MRRFWTLILMALLSVALIAALTGVSIAGKGGKGGGGGEDPPPSNLPPVRYQSQFFDMPSGDSGFCEEMNNSGTVVGNYLNAGGTTRHAFIYDPTIDYDSELGLGLAVDLNDIVFGIPSGMAIVSAVHINDRGDIAGYIEPLDGSATEAVVIDMNAIDIEGNPHPTLIRVPGGDIENGIDFGSNTWARNINEFGDVVGVYERGDGTWGAYLYNPGLYGQPSYGPTDLSAFVGWDRSILNHWKVDISDNLQLGGQLANGNAFRYDVLTNAFEEFFPESDSTGTYSWSGVAGMNNHGVVFGGQWLTYPKKIKGRSGERMPCRYDSALETFALDTSEYASAFNDNGDFRTSALVYQDEWGYFNVDDLIDPNDTNEPIFAARGNPGRFDRMNNRQFVGPDDMVGYPQVCGRMFSGDVFHFFILTPVAPAGD